MLKKKIQFKDLDGNTIEEEFYFNISKAELAERELSLVGGWQKHMQHILDNVKSNPAALIAEMKWLIKVSYGMRSVDGRKFYKNDEIYNDFAATDAYSELFFDLCTNAEVSADFVNGVLGDTVNKLSKEANTRGVVKDLKLPEGDVVDFRPRTVIDEAHRLPPAKTSKEKASDYTTSELREMSDDEWAAVARRFKGQMPKFMISEAMRRIGVSDPAATQIVEVPEDTRLAWERENRRATEQELDTMSREQMRNYLIHFNK